MSDSQRELAKLRKRLANVIAYCVDQTDGDHQPHDTHMAVVIGLAEGDPNTTLAYGIREEDDDERPLESDNPAEVG